MSKTKADVGTEWADKDKRIWARHAMWAVEDKPARDAALQQLPDVAAGAEPLGPNIRQPALGGRTNERPAVETEPEHAVEPDEGPASEPGDAGGVL